MQQKSLKILADTQMLHFYLFYWTDPDIFEPKGFLYKPQKSLIFCQSPVIRSV